MFIRAGFLGSTRDSAHKPLADGGRTMGNWILAPFSRVNWRAACVDDGGLDDDLGRSLEVQEYARDSVGFFRIGFTGNFPVDEACFFFL